MGITLLQGSVAQNYSTNLLHCFAVTVQQHNWIWPTRKNICMHMELHRKG